MGLTRTPTICNIMASWAVFRVFVVMVVKIMVSFRSPKYSVPYSTKDPKRDHRLDNHTHTFGVQVLEKPGT